MRTILGCLLMLAMVGCHCGPRCCVREPNCVKASCASNLPADATDKPATDDSQVAPAPAPKEPQAAQSKKTKTSPAKPSMWSSATARAGTSSSAKSAAAKPASTQDESVKQLLADLEKTKREKTSLQAKLSEESARQTQQRLELEARLAVLQEQMRQQSALQQAIYQQAPAMSRPVPNYGGQNYGGQYGGIPTISPGTSTPSIPNGWPNNNGVSDSGFPGSNAPAWNPQAKPAQQVEQWPHSPQR